MRHTSSNRRRTLWAVGAAATVMALAACGSSTSPDGSGPSGLPSDSLDPNADLASQSLVVSNWENYMPEDLPARFKSEVGTEVTVTNHATNEEIMAKLTAGSDSGIDVAFVSGQFAQALAAQGLIEPIHKDLVPNLANLYPEANELAYDVGNNYSVPYSWGTTGLCYRSDLVSATPSSWGDLLNPAADVSGKTTALATERWLMLPAQKLLGYSANTTSAEEMEKVKEQLITTRPTLLAYDDTTFYSRLVSGEASMVVAWDGWCNYGITDNADIKFVVPKEGSDLWADTMVILKTSKNKEAAHAFINYILDADVQSWVVENILYKVPNKAAMDKVAGELSKTYPNLAMTPAELLEQESLVDLGEFAPEYTRIATEVTSG